MPVFYLFIGIVIGSLSVIICFTDLNSAVKKIASTLMFILKIQMKTYQRYCLIYWYLKKRNKK